MVEKAVAPVLTDNYPIGTVARSPENHWTARKTERGWIGDWSLPLPNWTPPDYSIIELPKDRLNTVVYSH